MEINDSALPELNAISICAWVKLGKSKTGTTLSYAVPGSDIYIYICTI